MYILFYVGGWFVRILLPVQPQHPVCCESWQQSILVEVLVNKTSVCAMVIAVNLLSWCWDSGGVLFSLPCQCPDYFHLSLISLFSLVLLLVHLCLLGVCVPHVSICSPACVPQALFRFDKYKCSKVLYFLGSWIFLVPVFFTTSTSLKLTFWFTVHILESFIEWNSPKCNLGPFCECTRVKRSFKSIINTKAALLGHNHFQVSARGKYMLASKSLFF